MNTKLIIYVLALFVLVSCSDDKSAMMPSDFQDPLIDLKFSKSPIDLQGTQALFASDIPYDKYDNTKFDVFLPTSTTATGLVIFIHGGGFTG
ncbi:MAG: hypothetical protein AAF512_19865, partial [Pseudomonadota bacterium]